MKETKLFILKLQKLHITLFFLLVWSFSFCQQYTNYTLNDGLPSNHVYRITQDYDGFIWIITDKGMSKFDGKTFKNFTIKEGLPSNDIWNIRITPDNKVWFFTKANKLGYIYNDKIHSFPSDNDKIFAPYYIFQSGNRIDFGDGIYNYSLKDSVWQSNKNVKVKTNRQKVIYSIVGNIVCESEMAQYKLGRASDKSVLPNNINDFSNLRNLGQVNDSLVMFNNDYYYGVININTQENHVIPRKSQNIKNKFKYFRPHLVNGKVQLTGVNFVSYMGDQFEMKDLFPIPSRLESHFSFIDKTGNTWSATFNKGVYVLPKSKNSVKYLAQNKKVQELKLVDNTIYAAIFKEGYFKVSDTLIPFFKNHQFQYGVSNIPELRSVFFSSRNALVKLKGNQFKSLDVFEDFDSINVSARKLVFNEKFLFSYYSAGINKIEPKNFTVVDTYNFFGITSISKTTEKLLIGSQQGLFELKNDSVIKITTNSLFNLPVISQVPYTDDAVIVGTDGNGAYVTDGYEAQPVLGANELSVQDVFVDKNLHFWLATNKGVHQVVKKDTNYAIARSYYEADGLLSNNTNSVAVKNDSLYVATDIGISVMSLNDAPNNQLQELYLKQVLVNGKQELNEKFSTQYTNNNLVSFSVGVIDYSDQHNLVYSYKLLPLNKEWVTTTSQEINFTNLEPREYQLDLRATNHHGESALKTVYFTVTPLWYQTFWFRIGVALLSLLLIYILFKWSKNRVKKKIRAQEKAKQKAVFHELHALRSQMNPHFVFNSLNAIQYYMNNNELELSEKYLVKFSRLIRMFFDFSREQFITIDQEVRLLNGYLEIEKMRFGDDFKFEVEVDSLIEKDIRIPSMLLQPIVENAVNHGLFHQEGNGVISVTFQKQKEGQNFTVCIKDNGVGFAKAKEIKLKSIITHTSKSTEILLDRLDLINSSTEWDITQVITDLTTETSSGTSVLLTFNIKQHD